VNAAFAASKELIRLSVDRPTPFTKNATGRQVRTEAGRVQGRVYLKNIQADYLAPMIDGLPSGVSKPVPFTATANQYGNLARGLTKRATARSFRGREGKDFVQVGRGRKSRLVAVWSERRRYSRMLPWSAKVGQAGEDAMRAVQMRE
jgi:hypothetical protein